MLFNGLMNKPPRPTPPLPPARIWVLLASEASAAVIFRRGPSKWTRLYVWNTKTDELIPGSWFEGQLYAESSDLSPDGEHLIYFARNEKQWRREAGMAKFGVASFYTWTALCCPPWVKAIGLWGVSAGCIGGGIFSGNNSVRVYARYPDTALIKPDDFTLLEQAGVQHVPAMLASMYRSGWKNTQRSPGNDYHMSHPYTLHKQQLELRLFLPDPKLMRQYTWHGPQPAPGLEGASWADVDQQGRLVYARAGKLYGFVEGNEIELADLNLDQPPKKTFALKLDTP
jgi:hypothetical protein